ncbi:hypothetical protein SALWKB12_1721 [Snodgrassella communis]|jgi:hypothetical protein|uniref:Uncharacterized protein n=1 Tax=Snodgrassella communis TaxID=2946699 RepID=A0A837B177_9NEIS|nr:hypothetical protein SALWKB12_1721 [Snodgrassella communis]KDN13792.1 hypothetical protein SALWKB29_2173 [Snodgrassella communis]
MVLKKILILNSVYKIIDLFFIILSILLLLPNTAVAAV